MKTRRLLCLLASTALLAGCATQIHTDVVQNPPPAKPWSAFARVEVKKIQMKAPYAGQEANEKALVKIQENFSARVDPAVEQWSALPAGAGAAQTLLIEPVIEEIKFISGGSRFWAGAMAGSSAVKLRLDIKVAETGEVIATPVFFARAAAMGGAYSFGGTDNAMLVRIATRASDYILANRDKAVGGPSGAEPAK